MAYLNPIEMEELRLQTERARINAMAKQTINRVKPPRKYFSLKGLGEIKLPRTSAPNVNLPTS